MPENPLLIILARAPRPGTVKTRIAARIGAGPALAAYRAMLTELTGKLASLDRVELRVTPDGAAGEMGPWRRPSWTCADQGAGDLSDRLIRAFDAGFGRGHDRVAVIGSDCPTVTPADIRQAWQALGTSDVVLGPAADGGYWLVALRRPTPDLFSGIPWSTDAVLAETRARAQALGLAVAELRERHDIDTAEEWEEHRRRQATGTTPGPLRNPLNPPAHP